MRRFGEVLKVDADQDDLTIGIRDNEQIMHYPLHAANFTPMVGDYVTIIDDGDGVLITGAEGPGAVPGGNGQVNKVLFLVLTFFLGGLGIQKFYAGQHAAGVLCVLFCWTFIPSLIAIVDFFTAVFRPADANGNIYM